MQLSTVTPEETKQPIDYQCYQEVIRGFSQSPKTLPCKYLYDAKGSQLFTEICELPEYYITRTEMAMLDNYAAEMGERIGKHAKIIELGAGSCEKIQKLLHVLQEPSFFMPIDISEEMLQQSSKQLHTLFPDLEIKPKHLDFMQEFTIAELEEEKYAHGKNVIFFPGSTLGNFSPTLAQTFLTRLRKVVGSQGVILLGIDREKNPTLLEQAYDDKQGITAKFNKNLLNHISRKLCTHINSNAFKHRAIYNNQAKRVEMHLVSKENQTITIGKTSYPIKQGEYIHTENSYKYSDERFKELASAAGFNLSKTWHDPQKLFAIHYLEAN